MRGGGASGGRFGLVEWFRPGEHARVLTALGGMVDARARHLRTHLSWAEFHAPGGAAWYDWLIPTLGRQVDLLPCIHYTPPSLSRTGRSSGAPRRLRDYADFVDHILTRYGAHFTDVELWNEPNNLLDWDWRDDGDWSAYCEMIGAAGYWARQRGFRAVLGGPCPFDAHWLALMGDRGVLGVVDVVGLHGFPGTWDSEAGGWTGWRDQIAAAREILDRHQPKAELWITETGYSTWRHDELRQVQRFAEAMSLPVQRVYWYGWQDVPSDVAVQEGFHFDERHYHLGIVTETGRRKLLGRLLQRGGARAVDELLATLGPGDERPGACPVVVIGGATLLGARLAARLVEAGRAVRVVDALHEPGSEIVLAGLKRRFGAGIEVRVADLRDRAAADEVIAGAGALVHLTDDAGGHGGAAARLAAGGAFVNLLDVLRRSPVPPPLVVATVLARPGPSPVLGLGDMLEALGEEYAQHGGLQIAVRRFGEITDGSGPAVGIGSGQPAPVAPASAGRIDATEAARILETALADLLGERPQDRPVRRRIPAAIPSDGDLS